jgi:hypothetical protein
MGDVDSTSRGVRVAVRNVLVLGPLTQQIPYNLYVHLFFNSFRHVRVEQVAPALSLEPQESHPPLKPQQPSGALSCEHLSPSDLSRLLRDMSSISQAEITANACLSAEIYSSAGFGGIGLPDPG